MNVEDEKGFLIVASNNSYVDYLICARVLAKSIKLHMPNAKICLVTDTIINDVNFDYIKEFPYGDQSSSEWKLNNDWQVFYASPFRETIKLEADMIVTNDISHWWQMMRHKEVVVSMGCRDYKNNESQNRYYRKIFDINYLPDIYNAITYWRLSKTAKDFFMLVKNIFQNWDEYKVNLKGGTNEEATTDVVYAIASILMGVERITLPHTSYPSMIHMKSKINGIHDVDWTKQLVWEINRDDVRINTIVQQYPIHYHIKEFANKIEPIYDKLLESN